ncbi:MAG: hypothetical protein JWR26_3486 [Pedosphaera sp.]|nr:hypothetical protein [Pedosphaera sp.]
MNGLVPYLAQIEMLDIDAAKSHLLHSMWLQVLLIVGAIIVIVGLVFIWAIFFRKPGRRRRKHHKHRKKFPQAENKLVEDTVEKTAVTVEENNSRKKRRRSRREHRPRNPTLAETKGLPPIREGQSTLPPPY